MTKNNSTNRFDILCSIWIIASIDENPLITYEGLKYRLGLPDSFDVKALVHSRSELFRKTTPQNRLDTWKTDMRSGNRLPSWIRIIENDKERENKIENLSVNDVFRSQFRIEHNAPKSEIEIIKWGLEHIERLRNAELDAKKGRTSFWSTVIIPAMSIIIAGLSIFYGYKIQQSSNQNQMELKHYEVEFKPKQEGYVNYMKAISDASVFSKANLPVNMMQSLTDAEQSFYILEPFLPDKDRAKIEKEYKLFYGMCCRIALSDSMKRYSSSVDNSFSMYKDFFRDNLYEALFNEKRINE
jgi:hypothetical protein